MIKLIDIVCSWLDSKDINYLKYRGHIFHSIVIRENWPNITLLFWNNSNIITVLESSNETSFICELFPSDPEFFSKIERIIDEYRSRVG